MPKSLELLQLVYFLMTSKSGLTNLAKILSLHTCSILVYRNVFIAYEYGLYIHGARYLIICVPD